MPTPRRSIRFSVPPLWLIGVCLFLPTVRACEKLESPAQFLVGDKGWFVALLAPYVVAQLVAILAIVALARGFVSRRINIATTLLVLAAGASPVALTLVCFDGTPRLIELIWSGLAGVAFLAGAAVMLRARKLEPWARLQRMHAAYTIFTLPLAALLARIAVEDGLHKIGFGAPLFLAAVAALAIVHARALSCRA
ncbi:MAG TPA: hypothetical protein VGL86_15860 [Polyangia bacterium]|jgi:hypothetical protein